MPDKVEQLQHLSVACVRENGSSITLYWLYNYTIMTEDYDNHDRKNLHWLYTNFKNIRRVKRGSVSIINLINELMASLDEFVYLFIITLKIYS